MITMTSLKSGIAVLALFVGSQSFAAALCPPDSCNPHNGCMDGCAILTTTGKASCAEQTYTAAALEAKDRAQYIAFRVCQGSFDWQSQFTITDTSRNGVCEVSASAKYMCLR
jgi:hypothetical protein